MSSLCPNQIDTIKVILFLDSNSDHISVKGSAPRRVAATSFHYSSCCRLTQWVLVGRSAHSAAAAAVTASYQGAPAIKSAGPSDPSARAMAGEFWINLFGSCVMEQEPQPNRYTSLIRIYPQNMSKPKIVIADRMKLIFDYLQLKSIIRHRPKISRDMIGQPTNFRHTSHVGSSDIG